MKKYQKVVFLGVVLFFLVGSFAGAEDIVDFTTNPKKARFVYDDVLNFAKIKDLVTTTKKPLALLKDKYFNQGTIGLKVFVRKYDLTPGRLLKSINKYKDKYRLVDQVYRWLKSKENLINSAFAELKKYIPQAIYPPTYFLIGSYRGIGSGSEVGQLITIEKWNTKGKPGFETLMVHELIHLNQVQATGIEKYRAIFNTEKSLLALCIREGIAEFFAYLVTGRITQEEARLYVEKHEKKLWQQFKGEMLGKETGDWMWKKPKDLNQPMHIGYAMGFRIAQSYYNNSRDKNVAVKKILSVTDYPLFLKESGYMIN